MKSIERSVYYRDILTENTSVFVMKRSYDNILI